MRMHSDQQRAVTHTHKTVRKQVIDLALPQEPGEDEEGFIIRVRHGGRIEVRPADFQQLVNCLIEAGRAAGMQL